MDSAAVLVVEQGVEALTTRAIATHAQVPVASLYQYFADKEGVLLALAERDMAEMDEELIADVGALIAQHGRPTVEQFIRTALGAFVAVYDRRRAFVEIYLRGRTNVAVHEFGRQHNQRVAATLRAVAVDAGVVGPELTELAARLAVDIGDRVFQLAYEVDPGGDPALVEEGTCMLIAYLERYAASATR
ncbi:TetR family transcriptional regulator [Nocardioides salsibiostraticola]